METPQAFPPPPSSPRPAATATPAWAPRDSGLWALGERLTWVAGLVLAVSAFTGWYAGAAEGLGSLSVIGWHTGALGKLVFFVGLAVLALVALREAGIALPAAIPESVIVIVLGSVATILVLVRLISIPDEFLPADGRGIGIWISLLASLAVVVAGLLQVREEL